MRKMCLENSDITLVHINFVNPLAARQLTTEGYLEECPIPNSFGCTMDLATKAGKWLRSLSGRGNKEEDAVLRLLPNQELMGAERESIRAPGTISVAVSKYVSCWVMMKYVMFMCKMWIIFMVWSLICARRQLYLDFLLISSLYSVCVLMPFL